MTGNKEENRQIIINRLKKIEGQVKGIQRMVDSGKCCDDIMVQISAIRAAINKVGGIILENYIKDCLIAPLKDIESDDKVNDIISTIVKYTK